MPQLLEGPGAQPAAQPSFQQDVEQSIQLAFTWQELQQVFYDKLFQLKTGNVLVMLARLSEVVSSAAALGVPPPADKQFQVGLLRCFLRAAHSGIHMLLMRM